jgi:hypothetical protein
MPQERLETQDGPTGYPAGNQPAGDGATPLRATLAAKSEPAQAPSVVQAEPVAQGPFRVATQQVGQCQPAPLCACGHKVLARGLCSTCYSRMRNHAIKQGSWVGQPMAPGAAPSDLARAALSVLRIFRVAQGYWPSGALLLRLAEPGEHRRSLAAGLNELIAQGIVAHQLAIVGLAHRVVVPQLSHKVGSK